MKPADRPSCFDCINRYMAECLVSRKAAKDAPVHYLAERGNPPMLAVLFNRCGVNGRFYSPRKPQ